MNIGARPVAHFISCDSRLAWMRWKVKGGVRCGAARVCVYCARVPGCSAVAPGHDRRQGLGVAVGAVCDAVPEEVAYV